MSWSNHPNCLSTDNQMGTLLSQYLFAIYVLYHAETWKAE